jgi:hypothetical protein
MISPAPHCFTAEIFSMGVTVHYRGSLADLGRVEDFEDRVIDLALAVGGNPRLWRSADEQNPSRMVRGLMLDLAPGQETTSLLISPEGWLIGFFEIEDAEKGLIKEPPWCFVKTQFGPIEGHVALIELLAAIKKEFVPNLEVMDEGEYWLHRDVARLTQKFEFIQHAISALTGALEDDRLSPEAREDPEILATRIERLARQVHETISRPAEHPPVHFPEDETGVPPDPAENEARWDALFAANRRKQERMERVMEEQMIRGVDTREALEAAIEEVVPTIDWDDEEEDENGGRAEVAELIEELNEASRAAVEEPWQESVPEAARDHEDDAFERMERHPLQQQATNLLVEFYDVAKRAEERTTNIDTLLRNAMEVTGGLAQVLPLPPPYEMDEGEAGLSLVQLKRALRGSAFVRGTLFLLRSEKTISEEEFRRFMDQADAIAAQITDLLRSIREARAS